MGIDILKHKLLEAGMVENGDFSLRSGRKSNRYFNLKKAYGYPDLINLISDELYKTMPEGVTCVVGSGYGGSPLVTAIGGRHGLKMTYVRDMEKEYGTKKTIEGHVPGPDDVVAVVDDVFTSGGTFKKIAGALDKAAKISGFYAVIDRSESTTRLVHPVHCLFREAEFL